MNFNLDNLNLSALFGSNFMFEQFANSLSYIGQVMLDDDAHDFGWFSYKNRPGHPDHPSPLHHWQYGTILIVIGEVFKYLVDIMNAFGLQVNEMIQKVRSYLNLGPGPTPEPETKQVIQNRNNSGVRFMYSSKNTISLLKK